jgi:hypothetical protein
MHFLRPLILPRITSRTNVPIHILPTPIALLSPLFGETIIRLLYRFRSSKPRPSIRFARRTRRLATHAAFLDALAVPDLVGFADALGVGLVERCFGGCGGCACCGVWLD